MSFYFQPTTSQSVELHLVCIRLRGGGCGADRGTEVMEFSYAEGRSAAHDAALLYARNTGWSLDTKRRQATRPACKRAHLKGGAPPRPRPRLTWQPRSAR